MISNKRIYKKNITRPLEIASVAIYNESLSLGLKKDLGVERLNNLIFGKDGFFEQYDLENELEDLQEYLLKKLVENPKFINKRIEKFKKNYEMLKEYANRINRIDKLSDNELVHLIKKFVILYKSIWSGTVIIWQLAAKLEREKITEKHKNFFNKIRLLREKTDYEYVFGLDFFNKLKDFLKIKFNNSSIDLLTSNEIIDLLQNKKLNYQEIEKRKKAFYCLSGKIYSVKDFEGLEKDLKLKGYLFRKEKVSSKNIKFIKGVIAQKGFAQGKVRLIFSDRDIKKFKKGEIVVAPMTTPYYNYIIPKAAAIITDEGGITCHAAIISRELGIPCIIGTKIATRVLADGDLIEVNANKGLIKILKKKK